MYSIKEIPLTLLTLQRFACIVSCRIWNWKESKQTLSHHKLVLTKKDDITEHFQYHQSNV